MAYSDPFGSGLRGSASSSSTSNAVPQDKDIFAIVLDTNVNDWHDRQVAAAEGLSHRPRGPTVHGGEPRASLGKGASDVPVVTFREAIQGVLQLATAAAIGWPRKRLLIIVADDEDGAILHKGWTTSSECSDGTASSPAQLDAHAVAAAAIRHMGRAAAGRSVRRRADSLMSFALSKALCIINGERTGMESTSNARILVIDVAHSKCYGGQYPSLMNVAFAAAQQKIPIDVCSVGGRAPPTVVQQLSEISGGLHLSFSEALQNCAATDQVTQVTGKSGVFASFLMFHFYSSAATSAGVTSSVGRTSGSDVAPTRKPMASFRPPEKQGGGWPLTAASAGSVSYSVVCVCHQSAIDLAVVCSACLTIYCTAGAPDVCQVCNALYQGGEDTVGSRM